MATDKLYVHVDLGNGDIVLAGQLLVDREARMGRFQYATAYCRDPEAYALDPINLPLVQGAIYESPITRDHLGIAGALLDAGPDDWGKRILIALLDPPPSNDLEFLLAGSGQGVGTIYFSQDRTGKIEQALPREFGTFGDEEVIADPVLQALPREFSSLEDIMETALMLDEGLPVPKEKALFFRYGSSVGGVRPKTLVDESTINSMTGERTWRRWIVKFPRKGDLVDHCQLEHAFMKMAAKAGIRVPETRLMETALGPVLLVERFDVDDKGGRAHLLSARSLINKFDVAQMDASEVSYANFGRIAKQISSNGTEDNKELYRRMLYNIAIGNVDDHSRNHAFMKPAGQKMMQLTPAYDVLPTVGMEGAVQAIAVGPLGARQSVENLQQCTKEMGIDAAEAAAIAEDVLNATADWENNVAQIGMSPKDIAIVAKSMSARAMVQRFLDALPAAERERQRLHSSNISR